MHNPSEEVMKGHNLITVLKHPLVQCDISILREKTTPPTQFRMALARIGFFLAEAATRSLAVQRCDIETPLEYTTGFALESNVILLPILRAGMSLLEPFLSVIPQASIGYIGLKRNEHTLTPTEYYFNVPPLSRSSVVIILDPMLATGGSICATMERMYLEGAQQCIVASVIAAPEGIENVLAQFPTTTIVTASLDRCLNDKGYIVPGLGDAGDRINGTF